MEEKWYDNGNLMDVLLFLFPPIGITGIWLSKRRKVVDKIIFTGFGVISFCLILLAILKP